jgi:hypothetical protein
VKTLSSRAKLLESAVGLVQTLKQGEITLQTDGADSILVQIENNKTDLDFARKDVFKDLISLEAKTEEESILERLKTLGDFAEKLKEKGLTITISHQKQIILTLGKEAHPTISQMVTGTNAIEINNLIELTKLVK